MYSSGGHNSCMLKSVQIYAGGAKHQSQLNFAVLDNKNKICPLSKFQHINAFSASVIHDWDPHGFQLSNRDICIFSQMQAYYENNS